MLLLAVNASILLVPVFTLLFLRLYDTLLVRQTEQLLINESVLIGEAFRERLLEGLGIAPEKTPDARPIGTSDDPYYPLEPVLDSSDDVLPPQPDPVSYAHDLDSPARRAGEAVTPLLQRAQRTNLSAVRILDDSGCVIATTRSEIGACLGDLPEVKEALAGRYAAVARRRISDEPPASPWSISRSGDIRVFTALPVFSDGKVIAVVRMSRTSVSIGKILWVHRNRLLMAALVSTLLTIPVSLGLSRLISRPIERLSRAADAVSRGEPQTRIRVSGLAPRETRVMSDALARMTRQLTDRATYISDYAATVSHELKTPIAAIRGATELLREQWTSMDEAQRERFLANVDSDAARMERLAARLLELARIQSTPERTQTIDLRTFLVALRERLGGEIRLDLASAPEHLQMNPDHLESALRNLLENALRHGGSTPVDLSVIRRGERTEFVISDRGPGIPEAIRNRVLERFFTTERERGGTGLGLSIAQAVAEIRGGSLHFESGPSGTTFRLVV